MQAPIAQRRDQSGVVTVALGKGGATREHDPGMEDVGAGQLHVKDDIGMHAIEVAETGGPRS